MNLQRNREILRRLEDGQSYTVIAQAMGVSRGAVAGVADRAGFKSGIKTTTGWAERRAQGKAAPINLSEACLTARRRTIQIARAARRPERQTNDAVSVVSR